MSNKKQFAKRLFTTVVLSNAVASHVFADALPHCEMCPSMRIVDAGTFTMGKMVNYGYGDMDGPKHDVTFSRPFAFAQTEVTVGQFRKFVEATGHQSSGLCNIYTDDKPWHIAPQYNWQNPGFEQENDHPVVCISWEDTQRYIHWLNRKTGANYRLPSEAEWEYVASTGGIISADDGMIQHSEANIGKAKCCGGATGGKDIWLHTAPVGSFAPDRYDLYDVRGNVWEWQADCYHPTYHDAPVNGEARTACRTPAFYVLRGGSYGDAAEYFHHRFRLRGPRKEGYFTAGFRLAHDIIETKKGK